MLAHVQPEHLLLERQPLRLGELGVGDRDAIAIADRDRGSRSAAVVERREEVELADRLVLPTVDHGVDDRLEHLAQALAWVAERVEAARLHERLDRALVQHRRVDAIAEVVEVGERSAFLARGDDLRDHSLTDVAHRRHPEVDRRAVVARSPAPRP